MNMFRAEIRSARENLGLSLSEAAELIGCTKAHVWDLEQGKSQNPTVKMLAGIAVTYGLSLSYLAEIAAISAPGIEHRTAVAAYMKARSILKPPIKGACDIAPQSPAERTPIENKGADQS